MSERLEFAKLVIVGPSRNYELLFHGGVNVLAGPVMTGKSSALRLLDYAMGSSRKPEFPEIAKCTGILVECRVGGETLTIRRSLRNKNAPAELFEGGVQSVLDESVKGELLSPYHVAGQPSISSELMRRLGWGDIAVKTAPTQESSGSSPFSLRDLFFLIYLDQTRISDERSAFFEREPFKAIKWKAGVELVYGLHDKLAAQLAAALKEAEGEEQRIIRYLDAARHFLDQSNIPDSESLEQELSRLDEQRKDLLERQLKLREASESELGESLGLVKRRDSRIAELRAARAQISELDRVLTQLGRLRVQYERERSQLEFLQESDRLISALPVVKCPACLQSVEYHRDGSCYVCSRALPQREEAVSVEARLRATSRRVTDLERYLEQLRATRTQLQRGESDTENEIRDMGRALERVQQTSLLPSARFLAEVGESFALVERRKSTIEEQLFLRERAQGEGSSLLAVQERLRRVKEQLREVGRSRTDSNEVVTALSETLNAILVEMKFPYVRGVRVEETSLQPIVRESPYRELSSKGAVSLVVTAWHLAMLEYALDQPSLFPMLLLLDSPLSHVGRDSADPDFKDQQIVDAFYGLLSRLDRERSDEFQLIMVDNHPPQSGQHLVIEEFTGKAGDGRTGLISDE